MENIVKQGGAVTFGAWFMIVLIAVVAIFAMTNDKPSTSTSTSANPAIEACMKRGVAYYKQIGSYPTLSSAPNKGRKANDIVKYRCKRTTSAF